MWKNYFRTIYILNITSATCRVCALGISMLPKIMPTLKSNVDDYVLNLNGSKLIGYTCIRMNSVKEQIEPI